MNKMLSTVVLSSVLSLGAIAAVSTPASAQDVELRLGPDGIRPVIRDRDRDRDRNREYGRRDRGCSPGEARAAARDEGFRRPEVVRVTDRSITVRGWTSNGPDRITFANRRGCPEI
ncbi:hypothetical protein CYG48_04175 [Neorhizobium sp. SOG26]|uniref:Antifreeze protein n=1 Tax=Neorhizobium turbinariae TaxID=2937795 RepID=A0ABT0IUL9_9HYPH|nr:MULTISPECIES: hypothetical protein [Neorhizobium]AXV14960.1 hypothetical protein CYG48_04175 [Neorhizobium sp. SOG26]MCK8781549.1 hypothetical protein [Neorhizobium turbinariae]